MLHINDGLLLSDGTAVTFAPTPNVTEGRVITPRYIIVHYTADNDPGATVRLFQDPTSGVSAHLLIDRGGNITQFAAFTARTWHAGKSQWADLSDLNSYAIGIELTNYGWAIEDDTPDVIELTHKYETVARKWQTFPAAQLTVVKEVMSVLRAHYGITDIVGHDDVCLPPGRKVDPGPAFPWEQVLPDMLSMPEMTPQGQAAT